MPSFETLDFRPFVRNDAFLKRNVELAVCPATTVCEGVEL